MRIFERLAVAVAFIGSVLCSAANAGTTGHTQDRGRPAADKSTQAKLVDDVKTLLTAVEAMPEFSKAAVEKLLGVSLVHNKRVVPPSPDEFEAVLASRVFSRVQFSVRRPRIGPARWDITFHVKPNVDLGRREFGRGYFDPDVQPGGCLLFDEGTDTLFVRRPDVAASFTFGFQTDRLRDVTFVREHHPTSRAARARR